LKTKITHLLNYLFFNSHFDEYNILGRFINFPSQFFFKFGEKKNTIFKKKSTFLKKIMELLFKLAKIGRHCKKKIELMGSQ